MYMNATTELGAGRRAAGRALALLAAALLALSLLGPGRAVAQEPDELIGTIPGTQMSRDEFRARAMAQLATISLAAVTYLEAKGEYPEEFYQLRGSPAWNIEVNNMFKPRPLQSIPFEPGQDDYTNRPPLGLPGNFDVPSSSDFTTPPAGTGSGGSALPGGLPPAESWSVTGGGGGGRRVDPAKVTGWTEGDIFWYRSGGMLQLVLFAPDGTYYEWVDEVPNPNYRDNLRLKVKKDPDGAALYAAQLLYFCDWLLPRYYNLVQFMASEPTEPQQALQRTPASQRVAMASKLGLEMRNVLTHDPISIGMAAGDFAAEGGGGAPLTLLLAGKAWGLRDLTLAPGETGGKAPAAGSNNNSGGRQPGKGSGEKPKPKPGHGGGGRQPK